MTIDDLDKEFDKNKWIGVGKQYNDKLPAIVPLKNGQRKASHWKFRGRRLNLLCFLYVQCPV